MAQDQTSFPTMAASFRVEALAYSAWLMSEVLHDPVPPVVAALTRDALAGNLKSLNDLAKQARADHIIHTGDFGFYDDTSLDRIADKYIP